MEDGNSKRGREDPKPTDSPKRVRAQVNSSPRSSPRAGARLSRSCSSVPTTSSTATTTPTSAIATSVTVTPSSTPSSPIPAPRTQRTTVSSTATTTTTSSPSPFPFSLELPEFEHEGKWWLPVKLSSSSTDKPPAKRQQRRVPGKKHLSRSSSSAIGKKHKSGKALPSRFEVTPLVPRFLQEVLQSVQRSQRFRGGLPTKSPFYASHRHASYEASSNPLPTQEPTPAPSTPPPSTPPTISISPSNASAEASEQARAFFSNLPPEVASQLANMISQFSNRAPPGSRVVLVVRPLPAVQQTAGRRKYQLQLRYVREGETIGASELRTGSPPVLTTSGSTVGLESATTTPSPSSTRSEGTHRRATLRISQESIPLPPSPISSSSSSTPTPSPSLLRAPALNVKHLLWQQADIANFISRQCGLTPAQMLQKLRKSIQAATNARWPHRNLRRAVSEVFSHLEKTPVPKWSSSASLQLAIYRIELLRHLGQFRSALSEPATSLEQEDIDRRWAAFLNIDQKVKHFVAAFGNETTSCTDAAALANSLQVKWDAVCSFVTLSPQAAKPCEAPSSPLPPDSPCPVLRSPSLTSLASSTDSLTSEVETSATTATTTTVSAETTTSDFTPFIPTKQEEEEPTTPTPTAPYDVSTPASTSTTTTKT